MIFVICIWLACFTAVYSDSFNEVSTVKATYQNEKLLCNESEAVTFIKKTQVNGPYGRDYHFQINCLPVNTCNETCEWSDRCMDEYYGSGSYVGGIHSLFYTPTQERYLVLLCCNGTSGYSYSCETMKNYTQDTYAIKSWQNKIIRQSIVNHRTEEKPWIATQICNFHVRDQDQCDVAPRYVKPRTNGRDSAKNSPNGLVGLFAVIAAGSAGLCVGTCAAPATTPRIVQATPSTTATITPTTTTTTIPTTTTTATTPTTTTITTPSTTSTTTTTPTTTTTTPTTVTTTITTTSTTPSTTTTDPCGNGLINVGACTVNGVSCVTQNCQQVCPGGRTCSQCTSKYSCRGKLCCMKI